MSLLHSTFFLKSVLNIKDLPFGEKPEVCFIGKSNSGKSASINAIANIKKLAFSSKTPGCTKMINMFGLSGIKKCEIQGYLVDLPGYGYARLSFNEQKKLRDLMINYLLNRKNLVGIVLLVDIRRGLTDLDKIFLELIEFQSKSLLILLSKADKISKSKRLSAFFSMEHKLLNMHNTCIIPFSARTKIGLEKASQHVKNWIIS